MKTLLSAGILLLAFSKSINENMDQVSINDLELSKKLSFVKGFILELEGVHYLVEEKIIGRFRKYNSNISFEGEQMDFYNAITHFSLFYTNGERLLCDLQGQLR